MPERQMFVRLCTTKILSDERIWYAVNRVTGQGREKLLSRRGHLPNMERPAEVNKSC
jgi:hypothetical protein